ncbi:MAG: hypothetical protein M3217_02885 [Actinomycetota bacterium]|nr:hypothetical protein [Actinomycetota bacterium]
MLSRVARKLPPSSPAYIGGVGGFIGFLSAYWDDAYHVDIGRDSPLVPPHIGVYLSIVMMVTAVALGVARDADAAGMRLRDLARDPWRRVRPGLIITGASMLVFTPVALLDIGWHEVYGIEATIWSPPHVLLYAVSAAATLGLAVLVSPPDAAHPARSRWYRLLLAGVIAAIVATTAEFEFDVPQYRIAYHPMVVTGAASLVFVAAAQGPARWEASIVALWFQAARVASVAMLLMLGRSVPFVPLLLPSAIAVDLLWRRTTRSPQSTAILSGAAVAVTLVATNALWLLAFDGLRWEGYDLVFGLSGSVAVGAVTGVLGHALGQTLAGPRREEPDVAAVRRGRAAVAVPPAEVGARAPGSPTG